MKKLGISFTFLVSSFLSFAQKSPVYVKSGYAIGGYDPVAYFTMHKPVKGSGTITYQWQGANWCFSSEENMKSFKSSPEKYAPQYGGYCAYGLADGHKATTEADAWTISGGKLYLNYNKDIQSSWLKDKDSYIKKADTKWPDLKDKD